MKQYIAYYRVSTRKQGDSGLGLEAQKRMVDGYVSNGVLVHEYTELESGTGKKRRPILRQAIEHCKKSNATLVIAKIDRLARNVNFVSSLYESSVDFICCDMPHANKLTIHLIASIAEHEADMIASRTKDGLKSIKDRIEKDGYYISKNGNRITRLGNPNPNTKAATMRSVEVNKAKSRANKNKNVARPFAQELRSQGMSYRNIANRLNQSGYVTSRGNNYEQKAVKRLIEEQW
jgi:DNA invertase Pin-like site-specific DNA recombinase